MRSSSWYMTQREHSMGSQATALGALMTARKKQDFYEARDVLGTGSPEGVLAAPVGTYYTDTAGTRGAWRWMKKTGTGNTGWAVVHGDTGWRDITSLMDATLWSVDGVTVPIFQIRRQGDQVDLMMRIARAAAAPLVNRGAGNQYLTAATLPNGWRPSTYAALGSCGITPGVNLGVISGTSDRYRPSVVGPGTWASGDKVDAAVSWATSDTWPTSLPGTAA